MQNDEKLFFIIETALHMAVYMALAIVALCTIGYHWFFGSRGTAVFAFLVTLLVEPILKPDRHKIDAWWELLGPPKK